MRTSQPGTGTVAEPGLTDIGSSPRGFAAIGQPVSVCHQWSITGTPSLSLAQPSVSGSSRSPAMNSVRNADRSYLAISLTVRVDPLDRPQRGGRGEQRFRAVSAMTRQNAPASGVPTGLPSYMTRRRADEQRRVADVGVPDDPADVRRRPPHITGMDVVDRYIEYVSATAWPPASRTTPLGRPVVPDV